MSDEPNIHQPEWDAEMADAPFRAKAMRAGAHAGSQELGATLYEIDGGRRDLAVPLPPRQRGAPRSCSPGSPEVRTPAGASGLAAGAVMAFARGEDGAHAVTNPGPEPARVLLVSTMRFPDVAEHLDTGALLAITGQAAGKVFPAGSDMRVPGCGAGAIEAGDGGDGRAERPRRRQPDRHAERLEPRLGDLLVLRVVPAADADRADDLAVDLRSGSRRRRSRAARCRSARRRRAAGRP